MERMIRMKLHLQSIIGFLLDGYTTNQLQNYINRRLWNRGQVSLEERPEGIFWMEKKVPVRTIPVYLAKEDPRRKVSAMWSEDDDFGREKEAKQVWAPHYCLFRCPQTESKWYSPHVYQYITMCDAADWVELLYLDEEQPYLERYVLTCDPMEEDPAQQEFEYVRHLGELTITGVRHYCERLHIPARLEGLPVVNVFLSYSHQISHLRELTVEEGVRKLDFSFSMGELKKIEIPASVKLVRPPNEIRYSGWYKNQPNGPVYFQNYYCGTKGKPESDTLILREGTVGVIQWADYQQSWRKIVFPASFTYIADSGFSDDFTLEKIEFPEGLEQLKGYFSYRYPFYENVVRRQRKEGGPARLTDGKPHTGRSLYELGRSHNAVRQQIPWEWLPTAPRLSYKDGWIAEYWYGTPRCHTPGYYAAFRLPSGEAVEVKKLDKNAHAFSVGYWTDSYLPPEYWKAEEYLECCAAAIRGGEPSEEILQKLNAWWESLMPRMVKELLEEETQ